MEQWHAMLSAVLAIFGIALIGAATRRLNWLTEQADQTLLKLVVRLLLPCLILSVIIDNPALDEPGNLVFPPLIGYATVLLGFLMAGLLAYWLRWMPGLQHVAQRRTFTLSVGVYNYGYVPIPLIESLVDDDGQTLAVLFVHNVGVELAMWTAGILVLTGGLGRGWWRRLINGPVIAIVLGLAINFTGVAPFLPPFLHSILAMLGACAIPLGILLIGATMADHAQGIHILSHKSLITLACALRLGVLPILFIGIAWSLPLSVELDRVIIIQAAMASAIFPIVLARHYGGDPATAIRVGLATGILSLVTMPLWITLGINILQP